MTGRLVPASAVAALIAIATPACAATAEPAATPLPAVGIEVTASADSDKTDVLKILGRALWMSDGPDHYQGVAVEQAWFRPRGGAGREAQRVYLDLASDLNGKWYGRARLGTDGHSWLGSADVRSADWHKEFFVEREIVETPRGLDERVYYTFSGASLDLLSTDRDTLSAMAGVQTFTGHNVRIHLRAAYIHVVKPRAGLSLQLRARYFHSSRPGELDYFSPRNFVQLVPVVQMRRFDKSGWMVLAAAGYGLQRATGGPWQSARLAELRVESPRHARKLQAFAQIQYSNSSLTGSGDYHYVLGRLGLTASF